MDENSTSTIENITLDYDDYGNSTGDSKLDKIISANVIYGQQG